MTSKIYKVAEQLEGLLTGQDEARALAVQIRKALTPVHKGERCLDPQKVYRLMRDLASETSEEFHLIMLDVRGRLLKREMISRGSLSQCPVSPRDVLRAALHADAHSIVFVHNHPSGEPDPSADDFDLTERLRAAAALVGVLARDHVIVATGGYYSFVEAGRWRR